MDVYVKVTRLQVDAHVDVHVKIDVKITMSKSTSTSIWVEASTLSSITVCVKVPYERYPATATPKSH